MASIPERVASLEHSVESVIDQVDTLHVYLNNYLTVPTFLLADTIVVHRSQDHGDLGDTGKFFASSKARGMFFTLDDDISYPTDYVAIMRSKLEFYGYKHAVCVHGSILPERPIDSYLQDRTVIHYRDSLLAGISDLPARDGPFIHPKAA